MRTKKTQLINLAKIEDKNGIKYPEEFKLIGSFVYKNKNIKFNVFNIKN